MLLIVNLILINIIIIYVLIYHNSLKHILQMILIWLKNLIIKIVYFILIAYKFRIKLFLIYLCIKLWNMANFLKIIYLLILYILLILLLYIYKIIWRNNNILRRLNIFINYRFIFFLFNNSRNVFNILIVLIFENCLSIILL